MAQCIVIDPVCGFVTAGGRAVGRASGRWPNLTTASTRSVCVSLSAFSFLYILETTVHFGLRKREVLDWQKWVSDRPSVWPVVVLCKHGFTVHAVKRYHRRNGKRDLYRKLGINIDYTLLCTIESFTKYRTRTAISRQTSDSSQLHATESYLICRKTVITRLTMACLHILYNFIHLSRQQHTHVHTHKWNLTRPKEGCGSGFLKAYVF